MTGTNPYGTEPMISVIVPSYNQGAFIRSTILSIYGQSYANWELIIQDACSTDATESVCRQFAETDSRIRFYREKDKGFADGVNRGLAKANGVICAIQSSDDFYAGPEVFMEAVRNFTAFPECQLLAGDFRMVDRDYRELTNSPDSSSSGGMIEAEAVFRLMETLPQSSTFFQKERALEVGGLRPELDMVADTDFWIRMATYEPIIPGAIRRAEVVWSYAIMHDHQRSTDASKFMKGRAAMFLRFLNDRRCAVGSVIREQTFYGNLVDAFHSYLLKRLPLDDIQQIYGSAYDRPLPWSWRLKSLLTSVPFIHRSYFKDAVLPETTTFLAGGRKKDVRWFDDAAPLLTPC